MIEPVNGIEVGERRAGRLGSDDICPVDLRRCVKSRTGLADVEGIAVWLGVRVMNVLNVLRDLVVVVGRVGVVVDTNDIDVFRAWPVLRVVGVVVPCALNTKHISIEELSDLRTAHDRAPVHLCVRYHCLDSVVNDLPCIDEVLCGSLVERCACAVIVTVRVEVPVLS